MREFKTPQSAVTYLQFEGYEPTALQNICGHICQTWEEVAEQLTAGNVHTVTGDWEYFGINNDSHLKKEVGR